MVLLFHVSQWICSEKVFVPMKFRSLQLYLWDGEVPAKKSIYM